MLLRGVAVTALALASLLSPAGAAHALAADDALTLVSTSSYSLVPDKGLVHVIVDITATNNKPNKVEQTANGTLTTRYFFDEAGIAVQPEAASIRASAGKSKLTTRVTPDDGFTVLRVRFLGDLQYKQTTTFRIEYDLPGGAPRSDSDIRVGSAFATFRAWAFGDRGDVSIVIPAEFDVETTDSMLTESVQGGVTLLAAKGIVDPTQWYAVVVANRHDALTQERLDLKDGEHLVVRAWPEDTEWRTRVGDLLRRGLPVLVEKIGLDWPVEGDIEVAEVHTPLLEGYAGIYYATENRIEISEDLDELTIIHEASHAWFNSGLFVGRWINEGFADEYASRVLDEVSTGGLDYDSVSPTSEGHVSLNAWAFPGRIDDATTDAIERFGYAASWRLIRSLTTEMSEGSMRRVFAAADANQTAYVGASVIETVTIPNDWRRFLDLLEQVGGSTTAEDLFRTWVVTTEQEALLDTRGKARTAYAALVQAGNGWKPGYVIRDPMGRWEFARATTRMTEATDILAIRDQIAARASGLGVAPPGSLQVAYEGATKDLGSVGTLATAQLEAVTALDAAAGQVAAERDVFTSLGLLGEDPAASLAAASGAFSAGDTATADAGAASLESLMAGAPDAGRTRAFVAGLAGGAVLAAGAGGAVAMRRRRQQFVGPMMTWAPQPAPVSSPGPVEPVEPSEPVEPVELVERGVDARARGAALQTSALLAKFRPGRSTGGEPTDAPAAAPLPDPPKQPDTYATLGDPPPVEAAGDPAEPGRDEGDGT
jgi:hypothetical protein